MDLWVYLLVMGLLFVFLIVFFLKHIVGPKKIDGINKLMEAGQYKRAIRDCQALIKKNDRNHRAHYLMGLAYMKSNQMDQAMVEFKYVTRLNKFDDMVKEEEVRNNLAEVYLHFGQIEEAQKEFLLISKLNPSNYKVIFKIAKLFYDRNYTENAYVYFSKVLKVNQKHAESHYYSGLILYHNKKANEAMASLSNAIKYDPSLHKANYYLGQINRSNNSFQQAISCFDDAQKDPEFQQRARLAKGQCLLEINDVNKAILELERAIKDIKSEDNTSLNLRYTLASAYEQIRDLPSAIQQWEKIASYKPGFQDVLEKLSMYQELRTDDHLKDFLTASNQAFEGICRDLVGSMGYDIVKFKSVDGNHAIIMATEPESKWRNIKVTNKLIHIFRENHSVEEQTMRSILEEMKQANANKAIVITSTKFSPAAKEFAAARPIHLIDKGQLAKQLKKV